MFTFESHKDFAIKKDNKSPLKSFREQFVFPKPHSKDKVLYFAGHSLGLMPKGVRDYMNEECDAWGEYGVEGHFKGKRPWLPYHENLTESFAHLVGGKPNEVVAMNSLTVNLHLMLVSFYRPTKERFKIMIEGTTFPSDKYAVDSQARFHGFDPKEAIIELHPRDGEELLREEDILQAIEDNKDSLALVMFGNCNYLTGQYFPIKEMTAKAHEVGALCGFNLAHGAGNLLLDLHRDQVDFAVWCSYKYLNSGPGGLAGAFVHERHHTDPSIPRFEGWWGTNKQTRFIMAPDFDPIQTVEAWQLSNPPIFQLASLRASMDLFDKATILGLRKKGDELTAYLEFLLKENLAGKVEVVTPSFDSEKTTRGNMLCIKILTGDPQSVEKKLKEKDVILDFRQPNILRMAPAPMYNSFQDAFELVEILNEAL